MTTIRSSIHLREGKTGKLQKPPWNSAWGSSETLHARGQPPSFRAQKDQRSFPVLIHCFPFLTGKFPGLQIPFYTTFVRSFGDIACTLWMMNSFLKAPLSNPRLHARWVQVGKWMVWAWPKCPLETLSCSRMTQTKTWLEFISPLEETSQLHGACHVTNMTFSATCQGCKLPW